MKLKYANFAKLNYVWLRTQKYKNQRYKNNIILIVAALF